MSKLTTATRRSTHHGRHDRDHALHGPGTHRRHRAIRPYRLGSLTDNELIFYSCRKRLTTTFATTITTSEYTVSSTLAVAATETTMFAVTTPVPSTVASTVASTETTSETTTVITVPSESPAASTGTFGLCEAIFVFLRWRRRRVGDMPVNTGWCLRRLRCRLNNLCCNGRSGARRAEFGMQTGDRWEASIILRCPIDCTCLGGLSWKREELFKQKDK